MRDLGSRAVMRWGSSPHARTMSLNGAENGNPFEWIAVFFFRQETSVGNM